MGRLGAEDPSQKRDWSPAPAEFPDPIDAAGDIRPLRNESVWLFAEERQLHRPSRTGSFTMSRSSWRTFAALWQRRGGWSPRVSKRDRRFPPSVLLGDSPPLILRGKRGRERRSESSGGVSVAAQPRDVDRRWGDTSGIPFRLPFDHSGSHPTNRFTRAAGARSTDTHHAVHCLSFLLLGPLRAGPPRGSRSRR